ncbi:MAG: hypothetical protein GF368_00780 [Candidatus Aenigmarchaeota archaeon]|nr:hypothetical protein [Candidatus Aenigmarchaeota archaeon]
MQNVNIVIHPDGLKYHGSRGRRIGLRNKYSGAYRRIRPLLDQKGTVVIRGNPTFAATYVNQGDRVALYGDNTGGCVDKAASSIRSKGATVKIIKEGVAP